MPQWIHKHVHMVYLCLCMCVFCVCILRMCVCVCMCVCVYIYMNKHSLPHSHHPYTATVGNYMHAHAVSYIAIDITDTNLNILMEFCPGGSVAHLLKAFGALEEDVIRSYTKQILEVSQFIYANVHGATLSVRTNKEFTVAPRRQSDDMYVCERIWKVHYMRT